MAALEIVKNMKASVSRRRTAESRHEVEFACSAPQAKKVCLAGKFNDWNATSMPMKKSADGTWAQDTACSETVLNSFGTCNSVIGVA